MFEEFNNLEKGSVYIKKGRYKGRYILAQDLYEIWKYGKNKRENKESTDPTDLTDPFGEIENILQKYIWDYINGLKSGSVVGRSV